MISVFLRAEQLAERALQRYRQDGLVRVSAHGQKPARGHLAGSAGERAPRAVRHARKLRSWRGMPAAITIRDVKTFVTQPQRERLVIVKVETSEPGLYGLGCATFTQRAFAVQAALERHFKPLLLGRDVSRIEDIWQSARANG